MRIEIVGLSKSELLLALYNQALFQGEANIGKPSVQKVAQLSRQQGIVGTLDEAKAYIHEQWKNQYFYIDYVDLGAGDKPIKMNFSGFEIETSAYDNEHGEGKAAAVVHALYNQATQN